MLKRLDIRYVPEVTAIYNEAILHTTAIFDDQPRSFEKVEAWFRSKEEGGYPVLGWTADDGKLLAFGSYGAFRSWPGYRYTVEHSLYVEKAERGKGYGSQMLQALIEEAQGSGYHVLVGGIHSENRESIALHKKHGFVFCGTLRQVGTKFSSWLDLDFYQLILP